MLPPPTSPTGWAKAVDVTSRSLADLAQTELARFRSLLEVATLEGPSRDGSLALEWVAPTGPGRFGVTLFDRGSQRHTSAARTLCTELFDDAALTAWDATLGALSGRRVSQHVGLAWDAVRGYRLKLFVGVGADPAGAAACLGLASHERLVGIGCDFWDGGRYRERRYFRAPTFAELRTLAPAWDASFVPSLALPPRAHAMLTRTSAEDALGEKVTWSVILPPEATFQSLGASLSASTVEPLARVAAVTQPFVLRPSAYEVDRYRGGREERELLVTLGQPSHTSGANRGIPPS